MPSNCELKDLPTQPILSVRRRTPVQSLPNVIGEAYQAIAQYLANHGEQPAGPPFAAYYNTDMQYLDVELGFTVTKSIPGDHDITSSKLPGGKAAMAVHIGPYCDVEPTYDALMQWIKDNGYEWTGVAYEFYLNDPNDTQAAELQTEIFLPLK